MQRGIEAGLYLLYVPSHRSDLAGYLSVRPDHVNDVDGPWWNQQWVRPPLIGGWYADFWDFDTMRAWPDGSLSYGISDGLPIEADTFDEFAAGTFLLHGVVFDVDKHGGTPERVQRALPLPRRGGLETQQEPQVGG